MAKVKIKYLQDLPGVKAGQVVETSAVDAAKRLIKDGKAELVKDVAEPEPEPAKPKK